MFLSGVPENIFIHLPQNRLFFFFFFYVAIALQTRIQSHLFLSELVA